MRNRTGSLCRMRAVVTVVDQDVDHGFEQVLPARRSLDRCLERLELDLDRGEDDRFLGLELVVHGRLGDAESVGDHLQGGATDAVHGEELERDLDGPKLRGAVASRQHPQRHLGHRYHPSGDRARPTR